MLFDLHVHSHLSACSLIHLAEIIDTAKAKGLDGVCITDHDTMDVRHLCKEGIQKNGLCVIFGMEYSTAQGDFLIFGPFETISPGYSASRLLKLVDESGGVAIAAHPFRKWRPASLEILEDENLDFIEIINGRNNHEENMQAVLKYINTDRGLVGGSDAHTAEEIGRVVTHFFQEIRSRDDFISSLRNRNFQLLQENILACFSMTKADDRSHRELIYN